jgi:signal peptidase II
MSHYTTRKVHFIIAALVLLLDRASKFLVARNIMLHDSLVVLPSFFRLTHVQNPGAAFGLLSDSPAQWKIGVLISFSLAALAVVSILLWRNSHTLSTTGVGLALIMGGALGNLWDRVLNGRVVDFLDFYISGYHWPAFNVADSAIVVGAALLVGEILFAKPAAEEKFAAQPAKPELASDSVTGAND